MKIEKGSVFYKKQGTERYKAHVLAVVPDNDKKIVVYKYWRKHKQYWEYEAVELEVIEWFLDSGAYTLSI